VLHELTELEEERGIYTPSQNLAVAEIQGPDYPAQVRAGLSGFPNNPVSTKMSGQKSAPFQRDAHLVANNP